jgi:universal stress protein A
MLMPTKILVPTDFSEYSDKALDQAFDIAKQYNAKVYVLHVLQAEIPSVDLYFAPPGKTAQQVQDDALARAKERLQKQLANFPLAKEVEVVTDVRQGVPYDEILKEGKEQGIDLIVIASLGRSRVAKYLIGGVARNVLKGSRCPVLLTK